MRTLPPLLAAGLLVQCAAFAGTAPELGWSKMIWSAENFGGRLVAHAAMELEVALDGLSTPAVMQLDTGAINWIYRPLSDELLHVDIGPNRTLLSGTAARRRFQREAFNIRKGSGGPIEPGTPALVGTLGAPFFEHRILLLDFAASRLAILESFQELPAEVERRATFTPLEYRNGKMFVAFTLGGREEREMFFDSGSSAMAVVTTRRRWLEMTGRQPADERNEIWRLNSWGNVAKLVGAPMKGEMCFGKACIPGPAVLFESSGLKNFDFDHYPYPASGLFGNVAFDGRVTVIVDVARRRFGLIAGSLGNLIPR